MSNFNENIKTLLDILNRPETTDGVQPSVALGTCDTAPSEQHKIAVIPDGFVLQKGVRIGILFANNNTYYSSHDAPATLNVNGTGNFPIHTASGAVRGGDNHSLGWAQRYTYYTFTGNAWLYDGMSHIETLDPLPPSKLAQGEDVQARTVTAQYFKDAVEQIIGESPQQSEVDAISNVYGAKNLLPYPYYDGDLKIRNGITFTVNSDDGSITATGTATSQAVYNIALSETLTQSGVQYKLNGCPSNGGSSTYRLETYESNATPATVAIDYGSTTDGVAFVGEGHQRTIRIVIYPAAGEVSLTFYPMIRLKSIKDATYVPYAKTNRELTQQQYTFVGVCESAGNVQNKVVTVDSGFKLEKGVRIAVKFSNNNSYKPTSSTPPTLNVNGTGAKSISISGNWAYTIDSNGVYLGNSGQYTYYIYNGTYWIWEGISKIYYPSVLSVAQLKAGTDTALRTVRADYLNKAITEMIEEHGGSGHTIVDSNGVSDIVNVLGAKNLLKIDVNYATKNGVTFTYNGDDGSITVNGTATADIWNYISTQDFGDVTFNTYGSDNSAYILSGLPSNDSENFFIRYSGTNKEVVFFVKSGYTVDNVRVYPMIRPKNIKDDTWVPYSKTNQELTAEITQNTSDIQDSSNQIVDMVNMLGAKNLLPYPFIDSTITRAGITFTDNTDEGSITLNGTSSGYAYFIFARIDSIQKGQYICSVQEELPLEVPIIVGVTSKADSSFSAKSYIHSSATINITDEWLDNSWVEIRIAVSSGYTANNITVYPMIRLKSINDATWRPYAKTNLELTNTPSTFVGTCDSEGNVQYKVVTVDSNFQLVKGARIAVKFSKSNTFNATSSAHVTLNVNNTRNVPIYFNQGFPTGTNTKAFGCANRYNYYIYDGTYWIWDGCGIDDNTTYSSITVDELKTGTATNQRTVRADYLKQAISEICNEYNAQYVPMISKKGFGNVNGSGKVLYAHLATITIKGQYVNHPILFEISGRGYHINRVQIMFQSTNTRDPNLKFFECDHDTVFYIYKSDVSTWNLYGKFSELHGSFYIERIVAKTDDYFTVEVINQPIEELPADSILVKQVFKSQADLDRAVAATRIDGTLTDASQLKKGLTAYGKGGKLITGTREQNATYTFAESYSGEVVDLGADNTYRYVNASALKTNKVAISSFDYMFSSEENFNNIDEILSVIKPQSIKRLFRAFYDHYEYSSSALDVNEIFTKLQPYLSDQCSMQYMYDNAWVNLSNATDTFAKYIDLQGLFRRAQIASNHPRISLNIPSCTDFSYIFNEAQNTPFDIDLMGNRKTIISNALMAFAGSFARKIALADLKVNGSMERICENCERLVDFDGDICQPNSLYHAFNNCPNLESVAIDLSNVSSQRGLDLSIEKCEKLVYFNIFESSIGPLNLKTDLVLKLPPNMKDIDSFLDTLPDLTNTPSFKHRYIELDPACDPDMLSQYNVLYGKKGYHIGCY